MKINRLALLVIGMALSICAYGVEIKKQIVVLNPTNFGIIYNEKNTKFAEKNIKTELKNNEQYKLLENDKIPYPDTAVVRSLYSNNTSTAIARYMKSNYIDKIIVTGVKQNIEQQIDLLIISDDGYINKIEKKFANIDELSDIIGGIENIIQSDIAMEKERKADEEKRMVEEKKNRDEKAKIEAEAAIKAAEEKQIAEEKKRIEIERIEEEKRNKIEKEKIQSVKTETNLETVKEDKKEQKRTELPEVSIKKEPQKSNVETKKEKNLNTRDLYVGGGAGIESFDDLKMSGSIIKGIALLDINGVVVKGDIFISPQSANGIKATNTGIDISAGYNILKLAGIQNFVLIPAIGYQMSDLKEDGKENQIDTNGISLGVTGGIKLGEKILINVSAVKISGNEPQTNIEAAVMMKLF